MLPYETRDHDGSVHFSSTLFNTYRQGLFDQYPPNDDRPRLELELAYPNAFLQDVPVGWNPHAAHGLEKHTCFYVSNHWSTIFRPCPVHYANLAWEGYRLFVESDHADPIWGERICLMSTASDIYDHCASRFAFFRGRYWRITRLLSFSEARDLASITFPLDHFHRLPCLLAGPPKVELPDEGKESRVIDLGVEMS